MGSVIARHNSKILQSDAAQRKTKGHCNCNIKQECPVPGMCNQDGVVYQTMITSAGGRKKEAYVGLAKNFKKRYPAHKKTLLDEFAPKGTTMSRYFWKEKNAGLNPVVTWKYLEKNVPVFNPITNKCRLCIREKFNIVLRPSLATLNSRQEIFAHCRHIIPELITAAPD